MDSYIDYIKKYNSNDTDIESESENFDSPDHLVDSQLENVELPVHSVDSQSENVELPVHSVDSLSKEFFDENSPEISVDSTDNEKIEKKNLFFRSFKVNKEEEKVEEKENEEEKVPIRNKTKKWNFPYLKGFPNIYIPNNITLEEKVDEEKIDEEEENVEPPVHSMDSVNKEFFIENSPKLSLDSTNNNDTEEKVEIRINNIPHNLLNLNPHYRPSPFVLSPNSGNSRLILNNVGSVIKNYSIVTPSSDSKIDEEKVNEEKVEEKVEEEKVDVEEKVKEEKVEEKAEDNLLTRLINSLLNFVKFK